MATSTPRKPCWTSIPRGRALAWALVVPALGLTLSAPAESTAEPEAVQAGSAKAGPAAPTKAAPAAPTKTAPAAAPTEPAAGSKAGSASPAPEAPAPRPDPALDVIEMHVGIPGTIWLGQPLTEVLARFPDVKKLPFANQPQVLQLQLPTEGISALAMGETPASMTVESIGFNFAEPYEGVQPGHRRTVEGIGQGSNVNELLEAYGKPAESAPETRRGAIAPVAPGTPPSGAPERIRHLYRNADRSVTTYFIVDGTRVLRMAMSRPAAVGRFVLRPPAGAAPPAKR